MSLDLHVLWCCLPIALRLIGSRLSSRTGMHAARGVRTCALRKEVLLVNAEDRVTSERVDGLAPSESRAFQRNKHIDQR